MVRGEDEEEGEPNECCWDRKGKEQHAREDGVGSSSGERSEARLEDDGGASTGTEAGAAARKNTGLGGRG